MHIYIYNVLFINSPYSACAEEFFILLKQLHVRATVVAQTSQFATVNLVYPLTLENSGGTWMVAAIDLVPQVGGQSEADPVAKPHS